MKQRARRAVIGRGEVKRQRRGDRLVAVPRASQPKAARFREREARGAVGLERWWRIHLKLLLDVGAASSDRVFWKRKKPRDPIRRQGRRSQTQTSAHTAIMRRRRAMNMVEAIVMGAAIRPRLSGVKFFHVRQLIPACPMPPATAIRRVSPSRRRPAA